MYKASLEGFDVSLNLPASSDPTTKAINSYVSRVAKVSGKSAEPYVIASYSVKNSSSEPTIMVDFNFSLTLSEGKKIDGQFAQLFVGDQQEKLEAPFDTGFYNEGVDLISNLIDMDTTDIAPGASGTAYCVFHTGDLTGIKKVSVSKSGTSKEMTSQ